jgi:hypothetical protein
LPGRRENAAVVGRTIFEAIDDGKNALKVANILTESKSYSLMKFFILC